MPSNDWRRASRRRRTQRDVETDHMGRPRCAAFGSNIRRLVRAAFAAASMITEVVKVLWKITSAHAHLLGAASAATLQSVVATYCICTSSDSLVDS